MQPRAPVGALRLALGIAVLGVALALALIVVRGYCWLPYCSLP